MSLDISSFLLTLLTHLCPQTRRIFQEIPPQLSEEETLKRTVSSIPREILDSLVLSAIESGQPVTSAAIHQTFNDLLRKGVLQLPVEVGTSFLGAREGFLANTFALQVGRFHPLHGHGPLPRSFPSGGLPSSLISTLLTLTHSNSI